MKNKIYKGVIHSLLPQKGFGFITPVWANGDSEENIFFHLSETKGGKCYIPALASAENRKEIVSKKGTKTYIPNEPQVVFFELQAEIKNDNTEKLIAKKIRDSKNVSDEEAEEADANTVKPSIDELLNPSEQTVNLAVTPETIKQVEEPESDKAEVVEKPQETEVVDNDASSDEELRVSEYADKTRDPEDHSYSASEQITNECLEDTIEEEPEEEEEEIDYDEYAEDYDDEYEEYQEEYDRLDAKQSRRYSPKDNRRDQ